MPKYWTSFCRLTTTQRKQRTIRDSVFRTIRHYFRVMQENKKSLLPKSLITRNGWFNVQVSRIKGCHSLNLGVLNRCCTRSCTPLMVQDGIIDDFRLCSMTSPLTQLVKTSLINTVQSRGWHRCTSDMMEWCIGEIPHETWKPKALLIL